MSRSFFLALDIGNSNMELGIFELGKEPKGKVLKDFRFRTQKNRTADELYHIFSSVLNLFAVERVFSLSSVRACIVSSVVPSLNRPIREMLRKYFSFSPIWVSHSMKLGLEFEYPNPEEIGADRIVNAVAVNELYGNSAIIIDFGTATTFCVLSKGKYLGGMIDSGIFTSIEALSQRAEKLPQIELEKPLSILGKTTVEAIRSGVYHSTLSGIKGIIQKLKEELKQESKKGEKKIKSPDPSKVTDHCLCESPLVLATGGEISWIAWIQEIEKLVDVFDPKLTLKGLEILFYKNR